MDNFIKNNLGVPEISSFISKVSLLMSEINKKEPSMDLNNPANIEVIKSIKESLDIYSQSIESASQYYREIEKEKTFSES